MVLLNLSPIRLKKMKYQCQRLKSESKKMNRSSDKDLLGKIKHDQKECEIHRWNVKKWQFPG